MSRKPRTLGDAVIRGRALNAALDEALSKSGRVRDDPGALALRADLNVPEALKEFERELATLVNGAFVAEMEWANVAKDVEAWKGRRLTAEQDGKPFLAHQALTRQQEAGLLASELRLDFEEWQQMVADYSAIIAKLKERLSS